MSQSSKVDFGPTAQDYAKHRAGFPASFFQKLLAQPALAGRSRVLDLGTGTGTVARGFAKAGFEVTGLDPSGDLVAQAEMLDRQAGVSTQYVIGTAEKTGFPDHSFDIVTAGQCFHWFDRPKAEAEIRRILRPGGLFIVAYFDWIETPDNPAGVMRVLQRKYNPAWKGMPGGYAGKPEDLSFAGFVPQGHFLYEEGIPYTHENWRGRIRAYAGVGGTLPKPVVEQFDAEFAQALKARFTEDPLTIPHKVWAGIWQLQS